MARWFDEQRWEPVTTRTLREIVNNVSSHKRTNIAVEWASGRVWDGHDRYHEALEHAGMAVNDYSMAVMRYWWSAHGGRVVSPGHQCDSIIVLQGDQGIGKSRLIQSLAPDIRDVCTYRDITIDQLLIDDKSARALKGCLIANMDEMRNFSRREAPEVKAALSKRRESYVPKYLESRQEFGRQCLIYATNNEMEFLDDSSGNRRYYVLVCSGSIDVDWFESNREQLWAQGIADFHARGVAWKQVSALAPEHIIKHEVYDEWTDLVSDYLDTVVTDCVEMTLILEQACKVPVDKHNQIFYKRVGKILKKLGWERRVMWEGKPKKVWKKVTPF
jgi:predicted P-loop ATPase